MPRLIRGVARTAVIAGTATAVSGRVARRQADKYSERDAQTAANRQQAYEQDLASQAPAPAPAAAPAPAPAPAAGGMTDDKITQLKQLADLKDQGILTEDEFAAEKAKILAS